jgi:hypothetical protein
MLQQLYREMADSGAFFNNMVMFAPAALKQALSDIYATQFGFALPPTRNVGGVNITTVETDFFNMGVVWNRFVPADTSLIADVAHIAPVFQVVPGKGVLFTEELAKTGASEPLYCKRVLHKTPTTTRCKRLIRNGLERFIERGRYIPGTVKKAA